MEFEAALALAAATALLVAVPGPNVALIAANTIAHGLRFGVATVLGTTIGVVLQLVVVVSGLASSLELAAAALIWLKWLGASGVAPSGRTRSGGVFDRWPGVLLFILFRAEIAKR